MWFFEVNEVIQSLVIVVFCCFLDFFPSSNWAVSKAVLFISLNGNCEQLVALNHLLNLSWNS